MHWPDGARFAFTVFDDTDNATVDNVRPVYDLLSELSMRTTKSVWVYPPRGGYTGESLLDPLYLEWIRDLQATGFEIGLHNVGDGDFSRNEILHGLELYRELLGGDPRTFTNHVSNQDNIYWWEDRFEWPFSLAYSVARRVRHGRRAKQSGHDPRSPTFWGDEFKQHVDYARNLTFDDTDTLHVDPRMPYIVDRHARFSNYWFSSTDGHTIDEFTRAIGRRRIDELEASGGACVLYTHFASGFVRADGTLEPRFEALLRSLGERRGWFVPVSSVLDHLRRFQPTDDPGYWYRLKLNVAWANDRVFKCWRTGR